MSSVVAERALPAALYTYAAGTEVHRFEWWARERARHSVGPFAGQPLILEDWQFEFLAEALAVDEDGWPYWSTVVEIVPRKNGKSTKTSGLAGYFADEQEEGGPIIGIAATSDEQAKEVFGAVAGFVAASAYLSERFHVRDYDGEIARTDGGGFIRRLRMDFRRLNGKNLFKLLADEIHAWTTPNLKKCWGVLTTGDAAQPGFQALCITTEGEPDPGGVSIMGVIVQANELVGEVEHRGALTISRNHDSRTIIYRWSAEMPDADPAPVRELYARYAQARNDDAPDAAELRGAYEQALAVCVRAVKAANPASWISEAYLARKVIDSKLSRADFLRYHACVAADAEDAFVGSGDWAALADAAAGTIKPGASVCLGFDGSRSYDTTVAAWASMLDDGRVAVKTHVLSARAEAPHHELCDGKRIDWARLEEFVEDDLFGRFDVVDGAFDPRYLIRSMEILREHLGDDRIAEVEPGSKLMRDALAAFHELVGEGRIVHDGDPILAAHIAAAKGKFDKDRGWSVRKRDNEKPIDALIAAALAVWRASLKAPAGDSLEVW